MIQGARHAAAKGRRAAAPENLVYRPPLVLLSIRDVKRYRV